MADATLRVELNTMKEYPGSVIVTFRYDPADKELALEACRVIDYFVSHGVALNSDESWFQMKTSSVDNLGKILH